MEMNDYAHMMPTPIVRLYDKEIPGLYVKREDMIPYSFGGNKARKAFRFFEEIDAGGFDHVVTYGSSHSNHCRVVANMAAQRGIPCTIIGPSKVSDTTYNSRMMELFGARIIMVPVEEVSGTIDRTMEELKKAGENPYFIIGGGHGNIGTASYVDCYREICDYERKEGVFFDYIFFASGTGTTQAGLVCGQIMSGDRRTIVGISIARKNPRGRDVVLESIRDYLSEHKDEIPANMSDDLGDIIDANTIFLDEYTGEGYGVNSELIDKTIRESLINYGMPLDSTYTGKAFAGMKDYIRKNKIMDKNILFIHTGGTPLFFDDIKNIG